MAATYPETTPERRALPTVGAALGTIGRQIERIPRLIRFGAVGCACALFQLAILSLLVRGRVEAHVANTLGFLASTQLNFVLSSFITWRDRRAPSGSLALVGRRLLGYNGLALGSLVINQIAFAIALRALPYLGAALVGILAGMLLTYVISGRLLFRRSLAPSAAA